jgi:hypothetical protein
LNVLNDLAEAMKALDGKKASPAGVFKLLLDERRQHLKKWLCTAFVLQHPNGHLGKFVPKVSEGRDQIRQQAPSYFQPTPAKPFGLDATAEIFLDLCQPACL